MSEENKEQPSVAPAVEPAPPAEKPGGRTYTATEVKRKMQGQGKALAAAQAELERIKSEAEEAHKAKLEADGKLAEALKLTKSEASTYKQQAAEAKARLEALEARETERLEAIAKDVKRRIKELPEDLRDFPMPPDPELAAQQLAILESKIAGAKQGVPQRVKATPPNGEAAGSAESRIAAKLAAHRERFMGVR